MALGGKRPGAGRPKGSTSRPSIKDYMTPADVKKLTEKAKEKALEGDTNMLKFLLEQVYGKAPQPIAGDPDNPLQIVVPAPVAEAFGLATSAPYGFNA